MKIQVNMRDEVILVPEGDYLVEVEEVTLRETRAGTSSYLNIRLVIVEGDHEGAVLWAIGSLRSDMLRLTRSMLRALGVKSDEVELEVEEEDRAVGAPSSFDPKVIVVQPDLMGKRAVATVVHSVWEGETRPKVRSLSAAE